MARKPGSSPQAMKNRASKTAAAIAPASALAQDAQAKKKKTSPAQFAREQLSEHLKSLGLTIDDLAAWRPPAPTRGRRAAK